MKYLSLEQIIKAHDELLKRFGGSSGVRDHGLLESAIHRPQTNVFGQEAYPSVHDKAAAICHSLIFNHAFIDGNKRVAFAACHLTLLLNGYDLTADSEKIYQFLIDTIKTHKDWKDISVWLKKHSRKI